MKGVGHGAASADTATEESMDDASSESEQSTSSTVNSPSLASSNKALPNE